MVDTPVPKTIPSSHTLRVKIASQPRGASQDALWLSDCATTRVAALRAVTVSSTREDPSVIAELPVEERTPPAP